MLTINPITNTNYKTNNSKPAFGLKIPTGVALDIILLRKNYFYVNESNKDAVYDACRALAGRNRFVQEGCKGVLDSCIFTLKKNPTLKEISDSADKFFKKSRIFKKERSLKQAIKWAASQMKKLGGKKEFDIEPLVSAFDPANNSAEVLAAEANMKEFAELGQQFLDGTATAETHKQFANLADRMLSRDPRMDALLKIRAGIINAFSGGNIQN